MATYIVRNRETKAIYGIFAARSLADLWDSVDNHTDPSEYEWARIAVGGMYFPAAEMESSVYDPEVPDDDAEEPSPEEIAANAARVYDDDHFYGPPLHVMLDEEAQNRACNPRVKWTPFDHADEGDGLVARIMRDHGQDPEKNPTARANAREIAERMQCTPREDA